MDGVKELSNPSKKENSHEEKSEGVEGMDENEEFNESDDIEESEGSDIESEPENDNDDNKIDILSKPAMENAYYICHNVQVKE